MNVAFIPARISGLALSLAFLAAIVVVSVQSAVGAIQDYTSYFILGYLIVLGVLYVRRKKMAEMFSGYVIGFVAGIVILGLIFATTTIINLFVR